MARLPAAIRAPCAPSRRPSPDRIIDAARTAFVTNGYLGTTLAAVARDAGVSLQTVDNVVGGKAVLLKTVYDVTLIGMAPAQAASGDTELASFAETIEGPDVAGLSGFDRVIFAVADRAAIDAWSRHLDELRDPPLQPGTARPGHDRRPRAGAGGERRLTIRPHLDSHSPPLSLEGKHLS